MDLTRGRVGLSSHAPISQRTCHVVLPAHMFLSENASCILHAHFYGNLCSKQATRLSKQHAVHDRKRLDRMTHQCDVPDDRWF